MSLLVSLSLSMNLLLLFLLFVDATVLLPIRNNSHPRHRRRLSFGNVDSFLLLLLLLLLFIAVFCRCFAVTVVSSFPWTRLVSLGIEYNIDSNCCLLSGGRCQFPLSILITSSTFQPLCYVSRLLLVLVVVITLFVKYCNRRHAIGVSLLALR